MLERKNKKISDLTEVLDQQMRLFSFKYKGVMVASSGGLDSTVLFHSLYEIYKRKKNFNLAICHINFGLRKNDSELDQRFLEDLATRVKLPIFTHKIDKSTYSERDVTSTQIWARNLRYEKFHEYAQEGWLIALGHHRDDAAENILIRLARGTSPGAMLGLQELNLPFWRPFISIPKDKLAHWANRQQIQHREDTSNDKMIYSRNVIRHKILPELESLFPGAKERLFRCGLEAWQLGKYCTEELKPAIDQIRSNEGLPISWFLDKEQAIKLQILSQSVGISKKGRKAINSKFLNRVLELIEQHRLDQKFGAIQCPADGGTFYFKAKRLFLKKEQKSGTKKLKEKPRFSRNSAGHNSS